MGRWRTKVLLEFAEDIHELVGVLAVREEIPRAIGRRYGYLKFLKQKREPTTE